MSDPAQAAKITAGELVLVCSRYDLGAIRAVRRFKGGSRQSPKVLIESDRGQFLLKRRPPATPGDSLPSHRVALSHEVQIMLHQRGFPVAPIIGTRADNNSLLELHGAIYEMFGFIQGRRYDRTERDAAGAAALLAELHAHLGMFTPSWSPPAATYHAHPAVEPTVLGLAERLGDRAIAPIARRLAASYDRARVRLGEAVDSWPVQLIHGDWHPGNLLFREDASSTVAAVLDFDAVRFGATMLDVANAAFQFSVVRRTGDAGGGSGGSGMGGLGISINPGLLRAFFAAYRRAGGGGGSGGVGGGGGAEDWSRHVPWLMIEAMIVETVAPIAATGKFGKLPAAAALAMTAQAAEWTEAESERVVRLAAGL